jgi:hypothetical protein
MTKESDLYDKVVETAPEMRTKFLELGALLDRLLEADRDLFHKAIEKIGLKIRKAYYLIAIAKAFRHSKFPRARLRAIKWTKMEIISRVINESNADELVEMAESHTAEELKKLIRGEEPHPDTRVMNLYFTPAQYDLLDKVLVQHGASRHGKGLVGKEDALIKALKKVQHP